MKSNFILTDPSNEEARIRIAVKIDLLLLIIIIVYKK